MILISVSAICYFRSFEIIRGYFTRTYVYAVRVGNDSRCPGHFSLRKSRVQNKLALVFQMFGVFFFCPSLSLSLLSEILYSSYRNTNVWHIITMIVTKLCRRKYITSLTLYNNWYFSNFSFAYTPNYRW